MNSAADSFNIKPARAAIVHDWLDTWGGGEQVLVELFILYPNAKLFTLVNFMEESELEKLGSPEIRTSFIQHLPFARGSFRRYLPLFPAAIERFDLGGFDLVISSSHAVAKGVRTNPNQLHVCYCYTPMRYAWSMQENYLERAGLSGGVRGSVVRWLLARLRAWDYRVSHRVNHFVAISKYIAARIEQCYGRDAAVIYPPVTYRHIIHSHDTEGGDMRVPYFVTVSRMVPYKRIDLIVAAFRNLPEHHLVVIGDGPERSSIEMLAGPNVKLLGRISDLERDRIVAGARAFIFPAEEDFGIAPLEAQALGVPVIAYGRGGALETLKGLDDSKPTAMFFEEQSAKTIADAVRRFDRLGAAFDPDACRANAIRFDSRVFREAFSRYVADRYQEFATAMRAPG